MAKFYDTLKIEYGKCPPDCRLCEEACIKAKDGDGKGVSRIKTIHAPQIDFHGVITCNQCSLPACAEICPTGAITRSESDGVVRINEQKCVGCGLCTLACPYGGIYFSPETGKSIKCDMCESVPPLEEPMCVQMCARDCLTYSVREEVVAAEEQAQEAADQIELKTAYEALVKKHGRKKVANTFFQLSKR